MARCIGRHGTQCVAKAVLVGAAAPLMLKTAAHPGGVPMEVFDGIRAGVDADRSQFFKDLTTPFYGANRPGAKVSQGLRDSFWMMGMQGSTLKVCAGASHGLISTHQEQCNADLLAFIKS